MQSLRSAVVDLRTVGKIRGICKCLRSVYLQVYGEVAERLKAAVC